MIIRPLPPAFQDDMMILRAELEYASGETRDLWYRFSASLKDRCTSSADPFMTAAVIHAMRLGEPVMVEGTVSPSLLWNLDRYMAAWNQWKPDLYKRVEVRAREEKELPAPATDGVIMGFSGGIDSSFSAWQHAKKLAGRQQLPLTAGVFVLGFDIPLGSEQGDYKSAFEKAKIMTDSIGIELISVVTNFRELDDWWEHAYPAGLASVEKLFQGYYAGGLIAGDSAQYNFNSAQIGFASNPFIDGWLGSRSFSVYHDGADKTRLDKVIAMKDWPEALKHVRICWQGDHLDRNCCKCQKCIGSMLYFLLAGIPIPECFPQPLQDDDIRSITYFDEASRASSQKIVRMAREQGITESWVQALEYSLRVTPKETKPTADDSRMMKILRRFLK
jgi:hypothetical protein